jgi:hypothetical protein
MEELIKSFTLLFKISSGFVEILYLLILLEVLALLVLQLLFKEGVCSQRFLELLLHPIHCNGVALFYPLKCGLELGNICMAKVSAQH